MDALDLVCRSADHFIQRALQLCKILLRLFQRFAADRAIELDLGLGAGGTNRQRAAIEEELEHIRLGDVQSGGRAIFALGAQAGSIILHGADGQPGRGRGTWP